MNTKTVRFAELVKNFGQPHLVALWALPDKDVQFAKAIHENRVVTLKQVNIGSKKDFGIVGFFKQRQASFLIFPKSISHSHGTKVIGIKYDLVKTPAPKDPVSLETRLQYYQREPKRRNATREVRTIPSTQKVTGRFEIVFEAVATIEIPVAVEAATRAEARKKAQSLLGQMKLDFSNARARTRLRTIKRTQ